MFLRTCCAPSPYVATSVCGKEFTPLVEHQLYCTSKCANRARRRNAKANKILRNAGLPVPRPGFPQNEKWREKVSALASGARPLEPCDPSSVGVIQVTPSDIAAQVERMEAIDRMASDEGIDDFFTRLGYLKPRAEPDRSAEPRQGRTSSEEEAPDFRDLNDDADTPLDYPDE